MPTQRALKSIASGVLGSFVSRNNDIGGYWGMGILCKMAAESGVSSFTFDLKLSSGSQPNPNPTLDSLAEKYGQMLRTIAAKQKLAVSLGRAFVTVDFGSIPSLDRPPASPEPFIATLTVNFNHDRSMELFLPFRCAAHNPLCETKSCRVE